LPILIILLIVLTAGTVLAAALVSMLISVGLPSRNSIFEFAEYIEIVFVRH
jgi:hypothetical protein